MGMKKRKKYRQSFRAVSPVIAVLLMIAIVVIASLTAYAWVLSFVGSATQKAAKAIQIQSVARDTLSGNLIVYVQNVGQGKVQFDPAACVYVNNVPEYSNPAPSSLPEGQVSTLTTNYEVTVDSPLTIKVVTIEGTYTQTTTNAQAFVLPNPQPAQIQVTFKMGQGGDKIIPVSSGTKNYGEGVRIPITAVPQAGYNFNRWTSDTSQITFDSATSSTTWATVNGNGAIQASFIQSTYQIAFFMDTGGAWLKTSSNPPYTYGFRVQIETSALHSYTFASWATTGSILLEDSHSPLTYATVRGAGTIRATFSQNPYEVTFATNPTGGGSTTIIGTHSYSPGTELSIGATANAGYTFTTWTATGAITFQHPELAETKAIINGPGTITANFGQAGKKTLDLACAADPATIQLGDAVTATGALTDAGQNLIDRTLTVTYSTTGHPLVQHVVTTGSSGYADTFTPNFDGTWTVQVAFVGDAEYNPANSPIRIVTVNPPNPVDITFQTENIDSDADPNAIVIIDSTVYTYSQTQTLSLSWTPGTTHTLTATSRVLTGDSGKQYAWLSWSAASFTESKAGTFTYTVPTNPETIKITFTAQAQVLFAYCDVYSTYAGNDPIVNYFDGGIQTNIEASQFGSIAVWVDIGSTYTYPSMLPASTLTVKWQTPQTSDIVAEGTDWIQPLYFGQYKVTLSFTIIGGAGTSLPPTVICTQLGNEFIQTLTTTPTDYWLDQFGWSINSNLEGSLSQGETWQINQQTMGTTEELLPSTVFVYYHQFQLTVDTNQQGLEARFQLTCTQFGSTYNNQQLMTQFADWIDAGTTAMVTSPQKQIGSHVFQSYTPPSATVTMNQQQSITLNYS